MAKSSKRASNPNSPEAATATPGSELTQTNGTTKPAKAARTKRVLPRSNKAAPRAKGAHKPQPVTDRKPTLPRKSRTRPSTPAVAKFTDDDIRIRAYFISEKRNRHGIHGTSAEDWLEARR